MGSAQTNEQGNTAVELALDELTTDAGTQPRARLDEDTIAEYVEALQAGDTFPPVDVFYDGDRYYLADGFHRYHAHVRTGADRIAATVHQGTVRDAILFSCGGNAAYGLRRTREDVQRAIRRLVEDDEWTKLSDRQIARIVRCTHPTVAAVRREVSGEPRQPSRPAPRPVTPDNGKPTRPERSKAAVESFDPGPEPETPDLEDVGDEPVDDSEKAELFYRIAFALRGLHRALVAARISGDSDTEYVRGLVQAGRDGIDDSASYATLPAEVAEALAVLGSVCEEELG